MTSNSKYNKFIELENLSKIKKDEKVSVDFQNFPQTPILFNQQKTKRLSEINQKENFIKLQTFNSFHNDNNTIEKKNYENEIEKNKDEEKRNSKKNLIKNHFLNMKNENDNENEKERRRSRVKKQSEAESGNEEKAENEENSYDNLFETNHKLEKASKLEEIWDHKLDTDDFEILSEKKLHSNKKEIELKDRLILNYINEKVNPGIPKFTKLDIQKEKCKQIMKFDTTTINEKTHYFYDKGVCFEMRKKFFFFRKLISFYCYHIVKNPIFDNLILLIILVNTMIILISDPRDNNSLQDLSDPYFLYLYTVECVLKIFAFGFITSDNAYLKETWNILDFVVVAFGWASFIIDHITNGSSVGLGALRAVRTLRPLKSIKSINGLRVLIETLLGSMAGLSDIIIVLFFFFLLFAVAGVQMWQGNFKMKCINIDTGHAIDYNDYKSSCTDDTQCNTFNNEYNIYKCMKVLYNPFEDTLSFDNTIQALILVFVIATMEGWSDYYNYVSKTFIDDFYINKIIIFLYFHVFLFVGGYYLINLFLAVINNKFKEIEESNKIENKIVERRLWEVLNLKNIRKKEELETEDTAVEKLKKKYTFIERNYKNIPVDYLTLKDLFLLKTNSPEELSNLKSTIVSESKKIINEYKKEEKKVKKTYKKQVKEKEDQVALVKPPKEKKQERSRHTSTKAIKLTNINFDMKLINQTIETTLETFEKYIENKKIDVDKLDEIRKETEQSNTEDDKIKLNFSDDDDSSSILSEKSNQNKTNFSYLEKIMNEDKSKHVSKKTMKNIEKVNKNIEDQSESDISESQVSSYLNKELEEKVKSNMNININTKTINDDKTIISDMFSKLKPLKIINEKMKLGNDKIGSNIVTIYQPVQNQELIEKELLYRYQGKLNKMNKGCKDNKSKYISSKELDPRIGFLEKIESSTKVNKKNSMIKKISKEYSNDISLSISIEDENNIIINNSQDNDDFLLDISKENSKFQNNYISTQIDQLVINRNKFLDDREVYFSNDDEEESSINKQIVPNTTGNNFYMKNILESEVNSPSKNKKFIKTFVPVIGDFLEKNIEEKTKMDLENTNKDLIHSQKLKIKEDMNGIYNRKSRKIKKSKEERSNSIKDIKSKYPNPIFVSEDSKSKAERKKKEEKISNYLQSYRKHLLYLFNLIDRDVKVLDKFDVRTDVNEILGEKEEEKQIKVINTKDPYVVFNPNTVNIMKYQYVDYKEYSLEDENIFILDHSLKDLNIKALEILPINDFRNKKINGTTLNRSSIKSTSNDIKRSKTMSISINTTSKFQASSYRNSTLLDSNLMSTRKSINESARLMGYGDKPLKIIDSVDFNKFSQYFLNEEELLQTRNNQYKKNELQSKKNYRKEENQDIKNEIQKIRQFDQVSNTRKNIEWSNQDVLNFPDDSNKFDEWNMEMNGLENLNIILWDERPFFRQVQYIRYQFFRLSFNQYFDLLIILVVIINSVFMSFEGNLVQPEQLTSLNDSGTYFNSIYIFEFVVKIIGMGPIMYFSEMFHFLDVAIIIFAIIEMSTKENNNINLSQLAFLRVFRIFRVLRLLKVLRKIKSIRKIITGITKAVSSVSYILLILVIFILIFQLLGMALLSNDDEYKNFIVSLYQTFQLLTMENWNMNIVRLSQLSLAYVIYLIIWIFFGNWVLFNLFLSILLDSFNEEPYQGIIFPHNYPETFKVIELKEEEFKKKLSKKVKKKVKEDSDMSSSEEEDLDKLNSSIKFKNEKLINKLIGGNECERSLYFLKQSSEFRKYLLKISNEKGFDRFILIIIIFSTLRLIADTFIDDNNEKISLIFDILDTLFNSIFIVECVIKILSLGFIMDKGTYLRDSWNKLDFLIVLFSLFDFNTLITKYTATTIVNQNLGFLRVLRMLRILRPLRLISHNVQLKLIINSLFDSLEAIINVFLIVLVIFFIFSIVGITLFSSLFNTCYKPDQNILRAFEDFYSINSFPYIENYLNTCYSMGGSFDYIPKFSFINIFDSMVISYIMSTMEGWPDIMGQYLRYSDIYGLFFIVFILIVTYFFMNLFVGVMFSSFNDAINLEKKKGIQNNQDAERYLDFLSQIESSNPEYKTFKKKTNKYVIFFTKITTHDLFDNFIMGVILINMIIMAIDYDNSSNEFTSVTKIFNYVFTAIFIIEAILKFLANGVSGYFYYSWNKFDFFVVTSSIADLIVTNSLGGNVAFLKSFQIIRVLRVLRVTRVLRLVKSLKGLEKLLQTLKYSLQALGNVLILLLLVLFIFSILGCFLVNTRYEDYPEYFENFNEFFNFNNFYNAFLLVFRCSTGENWGLVMMEIASVDSNKQSPIVMIIFMILMNFFTYVIMLNLFLLVTLNQYDEFYAKPENPIEKYNNILLSFKKSWNFYCNEKDDGYRIKNNQLTKFLLELDTEFSYKFNKNLDEVKKYIVDLRILRDKNDYVYFHDVLFKMIKKEYGLKDQKIKLIHKEEKKIQSIIQKKIVWTIKNIEKSRIEMTDSLNTLNPLTSHLYFKVSFLYLLKIIRNYRNNSANLALQNFKSRKSFVNINENNDDLLGLKSNLMSLTSKLVSKKRLVVEKDN